MKKYFLFWILFLASSPCMLQTMDNQSLPNNLGAGQSICKWCDELYTVLEKNKLSCGHTRCTPCLKAMIETQIQPLQCISCLKKIPIDNLAPIKKQKLQKIYEDEYNPNRLFDYHSIAGFSINWDHYSQIKQNFLMHFNRGIQIPMSVLIHIKNKVTYCCARKRNKLKHYQTSPGAPILKKD